MDTKRKNKLALSGWNIIIIAQVLLTILLVVGEIKCIYKAVKCNWEPIGKAEIIYTGSALCGLGVFVGWIEIEDQ